MKYILLILGILVLMTYGCSAPLKGNDVCSTECQAKGFASGTCEALGVLENPCETNLNKTSIFSNEGLCDEYRPEELKPGQKIVGKANVCCCG
jgi:hypothetical protein